MFIYLSNFKKSYNNLHTSITDTEKEYMKRNT